eukprot:jgi/Chlat1/948/Chrsp108S01428
MEQAQPTSAALLREELAQGEGSCCKPALGSCNEVAMAVMDPLGELADALASQSSPPWEHVKVLLDACPDPSVGSAKSKDPTRSHELQPSQLQALLALADFLVKTSGQYKDKLLPMLVRQLQVLAQLRSWPQTVDTTGFFTTFLQLVQLLVQKLPEFRSQVSKAVLEVVSSAAEDTNIQQERVGLKGFMQGLASCMPQVMPDDAEHMASVMCRSWLSNPASVKTADSNGSEGSSQGLGPVDPETSSMLQWKTMAFFIYDKMLDPAGDMLRTPRDVDATSHVDVVFEAATAQLRALLSLCKGYRHDNAEDSSLSPEEYAYLLFPVCGAAARALATCIIHGPSKGRSRGAAALLLDVAEGCIIVDWHPVPECCTMCIGLAREAGRIADAVHPKQRSPEVLLRYKALLQAISQPLPSASQRDTHQPQPASTALRDGVIEAMSQLLHGGWQKGFEDAVGASVFSIAGYLTPDLGMGLDQQEELAALSMQETASLVLQRAVLSVNDQRITKMVLQTFLERLGLSSDQDTRFRCLEAITGIACLGQDVAYENVAPLLTNMFVDPLMASGTFSPTALQNKVPGQLQRLARSLQPKQLRLDFRDRLLQLFARAARLTLQRAEQPDFNKAVVYLGSLLPAISSACVHLAPMRFDLSPEQSKSFRNLWFFIAVFGLAPGGPRAAYVDAIRELAQLTPPLEPAQSHKHLEVDSELNEMLRLTDAGVLKTMKPPKDALARFLGGAVDAATLSSLSDGKLTFLLAVAHLEVLRLSYSGGHRNDSLACAMSYLEVPRVGLNAETIRALQVEERCYSTIVERAFSAAIASLANTGNGIVEREAALESHALFLLQAAAHRLPRIRELSNAFLRGMTSRFPQIVWMPRCMDMMLLLAGSIGYVSLSPLGTGSGAQLKRASMGADSEGVRFAVGATLHFWLSQAASLAPITTQALIQDHFRRHGGVDVGFVADVVRVLTHTPSPSVLSLPGGRTAAESLSVASLSGQAIPAERPTPLTMFTTALNLKSRAIGEIQGMKEFGFAIAPSFVQRFAGRMTNGDAGREVDKPVEFYTLEVQHMIMGRFTHLLREFIMTREKSGQIDEKAFSDLLRLLCWCPAYIFAPHAVRTGVFVWSWLLAAAPHLATALMAEVTDAWLWTVDQRTGLFCSKPDADGPVDQLRPKICPGYASGASAGTREDYVVRHSSPNEVALFYRLLVCTLHPSNHITPHPAACGSVFRLLNLALRFSHDGVASGITLPGGRRAATLLRDRAHRVGLDWFTVAPGFFEVQDVQVAAEEALSMERFLQCLAEDERLLRKASIDDLQLMSKTHPDAYAVSPTSPVLPFLSSTPKPDPARVVAAHAVVALSDVDSPGARHMRGSLLTLLCRHEAERLNTWADPRGEDVGISALKLTRTPAKDDYIKPEQWVVYVRTAWSVDPRIAVHMCARWPECKPLLSEVMALVKTNAVAIHHIPEAVPFLVDKEAAASDAAVLNQLVYWAPCSITMAMQFLGPSFSSQPRVMSYVLQVLNSYPPDEVTFFMPQLVQALRYDKAGLIEDYLVKAAMRSNLFAHQFIWALQAEEPAPEHKDEALRAPSVHGRSKGVANPLNTIVLKCKQRVIDSFSNEQRAAFEREFAFFDAVTSISGILKPLSPDERRAAIARELRKIPVTGTDLYLPTSPDMQVVSVEEESGIPLQSAAKVPIMVTFDVRSSVAPEKVVPQGCIFKVGDDCRQDLLALQMISIFQNIFSAVGLELYLYPYGVLPTGYERGIIEVVPNSRSRNQLGEQFDGGLYEIFQAEFGAVGSPSFEAARHNFIVSCAGYAVASLIIQPKDRHNGNLLIDTQGHLVHIDFGFILEISPGGNMRFESADFKLSYEMSQLIDPGGSMKSEEYKYFLSLCIKGYLALRQHADAILSMVSMMVESGLPCFGHGHPLENLKKRFHLELSERKAAMLMADVCRASYNKWTTAGYDLIHVIHGCGMISFPIHGEQCNARVVEVKSTWPQQLREFLPCLPWSTAFVRLTKP